jgi:hypothetical protein
MLFVQNIVIPINGMVKKIAKRGNIDGLEHSPNTWLTKGG